LDLGTGSSFDGHSEITTNVTIKSFLQAAPDPVTCRDAPGKILINDVFQVVCRINDVDCQVSAWTSWSACNCTSGVATQTRNVLVPPQGPTGAPCPALTQTQSCASSCVVNCVVSAWSAWSSCAFSGCLGTALLTCSTGAQTQTRTILTPASNGGTPCPIVTQTQLCMNAWTAWSPCTCNGLNGPTQTRTNSFPQSVAQCPACNNTGRGQSTQNMACSTNCDCLVGGWSSWSPCAPDTADLGPCSGTGGNNYGSCTDSCYVGTTTQTQDILQNPVGSGMACPPLTQTMACSLYNGQVVTIPCHAGSPIGSLQVSCADFGSLDLADCLGDGVNVNNCTVTPC